ncbi:MAG: hypothetical protein H0T92_17425 [Pyrinomonadaceae bacterium]|nr:hypothetical protein [Pyrinomonadaceae bacterium]
MKRVNYAKVLRDVRMKEKVVMPDQLRCRVAWMLVVAFCASAVWLGADAQAQRSRRPSRRITNPVRQQSVPPPSLAGKPTGTEAQVVRTAEETAAEENRVESSRPQTGAPRSSSITEAEPETVQRTVNRLSAQVTKLTEELTQLKDQQRAMVDLERLTRTEQRAESLRTQLREIVEKEANLQARAEQIEFELRPEQLERRSALVGTVRPDEVRDQMRQQLESERTRLRTQLNLYETSRVRLEITVVNADAEVDRLRARLDTASSQTSDTTTKNNAGVQPPTNTSLPPQEDARPPEIPR